MKTNHLGVDTKMSHAYTYTETHKTKAKRKLIEHVYIHISITHTHTRSPAIRMKVKKGRRRSTYLPFFCLWYVFPFCLFARDMWKCVCVCVCVRVLCFIRKVEGLNRMGSTRAQSFRSFLHQSYPTNHITHKHPHTQTVL